MRYLILIFEGLNVIFTKQDILFLFREEVNFQEFCDDAAVNKLVEIYVNTRVNKNKYKYNNTLFILQLILLIMHGLIPVHRFLFFIQ